MQNRWKIVITEKMDLSQTQLERLGGLGSVLKHDDNPSRDEWLDRTCSADFICSGKLGLSSRIGDEPGTEGVYFLRPGSFVSHPFVNVAWMDKERLRKRDITISYAPGNNRDAVAEWGVFMTLAMSRNFFPAINKSEKLPALERTESLYERTPQFWERGMLELHMASVLSPST